MPAAAEPHDVARVEGPAPFVVPERVAGPAAATDDGADLRRVRRERRAALRRLRTTRPREWRDAP